MNRIAFALLAAAFVAGPSVTGAGDALAAPPQNPIDALLIQPDVVLGNREQLELSDEQVTAIHAMFKEIESKAQALQQKLNTTMGQLAEALSADQIDETEALKRLEDVVAAENAQKRMHMQVMIRLRNSLTSKQRQQATKLAASKHNDLDELRRLRAKMAHVQASMAARAQIRQLPFDVLAHMQKLPELLKAGKMQQAEVLLDRVMAMLDTSGGSGTPQPKPDADLQQIARKVERMQKRTEQMQRDGKDISQIQQLMQKIGPMLDKGHPKEAEPLIDEALRLTGDEPAKPKSDDDARRTPEIKLEHSSFGAVEEQVAALRKPDVAWRKIDWQTCLIDGLRESRQQNKPIMLWVFIDRPIDDERC